ncbi:benzoate/H(+) symporter BenE family transporter [Streptomyces sp. 900116325]
MTARNLAAVSAGVFYLCVGLLGATVASLLTAMPHALVLAVAGVGLLATIEASLASALSRGRAHQRHPGGGTAAASRHISTRARPATGHGSLAQT